MSKPNETLNKIKHLLGLATEEEVVEQEVTLAEDNVEEPKKAEPAQEMVQPNYVTEQQLSDVKNELFSMIQALLEENKKQLKEVPQELAKQDVVEVELQEVKEIVHSPENEVEKKENISLAELRGMSIQERIYAQLNQ